MKRTLVLVLLAVVGTAAVAFACTNISTLNLSDSSGRPSDTIAVTGSSFGNSSPTGRRTSTPLPVRIHWNGADGTVLAEAVPDAAGNISASVTIPEATPGRYVLFAVQQDTDGYHMYGTPALAAFEVVTPEGRSVPPSTPVAAEPSTGGSQGWDVPIVLVVLGLAGGALFVAGFAACLRLLSPGEVPAPGRVTPT
jgi:hypothetical protein